MSPQGMPLHPPTTPPPPQVQLWRSGKYLVTAKEVRLPARCIHCNVPVEGKAKKKDIYWHHPLIFLSILPGILIYVILVLVLRKHVRVYYYFCREHKNRRRLHIAIAWALVLGLPGMWAIWLATPNGWLLWASVISLFAGLIYAVIFVPVLTARKIDRYYGWLKRAHPDFLATLPTWTGPT